jgi:uncharacterized protein with FMN-binding domain
MKNKSKILITISIVSFLIFVSLFTCMGIKQNTEKKELEVLKIENIDFKKVKNGEYIGEYNININSAKVNVFVKDGLVSKIEILKHNHGPGYGADKIAGEIIKKQTLKVDAITGATKSSIVLKKAIENAIKQGLKR